MNSQNVRFMYNGIKVDGKLYKAHFSKCVLIGETEESVTVYARSYADGLPEIGEIKNDSDGMTDYFETDRMRIRKGDQYWDAVNEAMAKLHAHNLKVRDMKPRLAVAS